MADDSRYPIPACEHRAEQVIQRSRFIATIAPASTRDEATAFIRRIGDEFADATHNCWAFLVGRPASTDRIGMSDDGEPHGTAGRPMLNVLLHCGLGDVAVVVTRYYGGTKLGSGGLVRAYSSSVQLALDSLPTAERVERVEIAATLDYPHVRAVELLLPSYEAEALAVDYQANVTFHLRLPESQLEGLRAALADATRGGAEIHQKQQ